MEITVDHLSTATLIIRYDTVRSATSVRRAASFWWTLPCLTTRSCEIFESCPLTNLTLACASMFYRRENFFSNNNGDRTMERLGDWEFYQSFIDLLLERNWCLTIHGILIIMKLLFFYTIHSCRHVGDRAVWGTCIRITEIVIWEYPDLSNQVKYSGYWTVI